MIGMYRIFCGVPAHPVGSQVPGIVVPGSSPGGRYHGAVSGYNNTLLLRTWVQSAGLSRWGLQIHLITISVNL